jgi:transcriptional regulator GlxA family with amidase domain
MPTKHIPKEQALKNIEDTIKAMEEAAHFLRSSCHGIYALRKAVLLEGRVPIMQETLASLRLKDTDDG